MPFPKQEPRPFTRDQIEIVRAGTMGCYGLFRADVWIYVGKGDIRQRLLDHLGGDNPCITRHQPTHFLTVATPNYDVREKELIRELDPDCNRRVG